MQIESSVPAPERSTPRGRPCAWPFDKMGPGDSFVVQKESIKALRTAIWRRKVKYSEKFTIGMHANKWRCWRVS